MTGNLTMSGTAANIILGSNYLSGDGGDEGIFVTSTGNVGIGTTAPGAKLEVGGQVKITGGTPGANKVLTSDSVGLASWTNLSGIGVTSVTGTAYQITASPTTGAVVLSIPSDFRAPGTVNAVSGLYTGSGAGTQRVDASGNLVNIGTITSGLINGQTISSAANFTGTVTAATSVTTSNYLVNAGNGNGLCFWGNCTNYKIHMGTGAEYQYGPVTDYSIKMNMNSTAGRGWTWGQPGIAPIAAIGNTGNMQIAGTFTGTLVNTLTRGSYLTGNNYNNYNI